MWPLPTGTPGGEEVIWGVGKRRSQCLLGQIGGILEASFAVPFLTLRSYQKRVTELM